MDEANFFCIELLLSFRNCTKQCFRFCKIYLSTLLSFEFLLLFVEAAVSRERKVNLFEAFLICLISKLVILHYCTVLLQAIFCLPVSVSFCFTLLLSFYVQTLQRVMFLRFLALSIFPSCISPHGFNWLACSLFSFPEKLNRFLGQLSYCHNFNTFFFSYS